VPHLKFDPTKLERLNDRGRFETMKPDVIVDALDVSAGATIVDIGAGTGLFAEEFARRLGATVYAVDTVTEMIEWMRANRGTVEGGLLVPLLSSETEIPLEDGVADAVTMLNLHHELAQPAATYAEAFRLLKPGGRIVVVDWAPVETPKGPPLHVRATGAELVGYLAAAGFGRAVEHDGLPWHSLVTAERPQ